MLTIHPKQIRGVLLLTIALFGLASGYGVAQFSGWLLAESIVETRPAAVGLSPAPVPSSIDINAILQGNIFDQTARNRLAPTQTTEVQSAAPIRAVNLRLYGTVDGGTNPLALIEASGKVSVYRPGDAMPGGGELLTIERTRVLIRHSNGREVELLFDEAKASASSPQKARSPQGGGAGIRALGDNRWEISQAEIDAARRNLGSLLKQARMEPYVVNGQTEGFVVRMIRPKSLLANLGMKVGDVVSSVNGVELNSAEKALQIFQQLREAKRLTVDLTRGQQNMSFEYEVN